MKTGIFIRVLNKNMDIGDPKMEVSKLSDWYLGLSVEGQLRLVMTLLGRRDDFEHWKQTESLKQPRKI